MDAVIIIISFLALLIPFFIAKLFWWCWLWVGIAVVLGLFEAISYIKDRKTVSQKFWAWRKTAPVWQRTLIGVGMVVFWLYLMFHLFFE